MKKIISILLCAVMLSVYFTVFSVPTFAYSASDAINGNISDANPGDTINLFSEGGSKQILMPMDSCVEINKPCTINFRSYYFYRSGNYSGPIFRITADNVTLNFENCSIHTGGADTEGSVFYVDGNDCTIDGQGSTDINDCSSYDDDGGVIHVNGISCTIQNLAFEDCWSGEDGGVIDVYEEKCIIKNCNFTNCKAEDYGGAIIIDDDNCTIENCNFNNCQAKGKGGAIYMCREDNNALVYYCTFTDCGKDLKKGKNVEAWDSLYLIQPNPLTKDETWYYDCKFDDDLGLAASFGSTFSSGSVWVIAGIGAVLVIVVAAVVISKKKKKAAVSETAEATAVEASETEEKEEE